MDQRGRDHVPLARRDVDHPADPAGLRDPVELAVVGVHWVQGPADGDHAVPGPVGLEVREPAGIVQARRKDRDNRPACCCAWTLCGGRGASGHIQFHPAQKQTQAACGSQRGLVDIAWRKISTRSPHDLRRSNTRASCGAE